MDRASYFVWSLLGMAAALVVFFPLGAKRRACIPPLVWWLCLILGAVAFSVRNGALRHPGGWAQALLVAVPLSLLDSGITSLIVRECRSADGFVGSTIEPEIS